MMVVMMMMMNQMKGRKGRKEKRKGNLKNWSGTKIPFSLSFFGESIW